MPGYEPYLLCDFHVHTTWSDGRLSVREVVDLYGQTGKFDVLGITDHILAKKDLLGRLGRLATLGQRRFSITPDSFDDYMADIEKEGIRAKRQYGMLLVPGVEVTQNHIRAKHNSHVVALGLKRFISADLKAKEILEEIRRQDGLSIACHPHHRTTRRMEIGTCYLWDHRKDSPTCRVWKPPIVDDLFSVTSLKHFLRGQQRLSQGEASILFLEDAPPSAKTWPSVKAALKAHTDIAITCSTGSGLRRARPHDDVVVTSNRSPGPAARGPARSAWKLRGARSSGWASMPTCF